MNHEQKEFFYFLRDNMVKKICVILMILPLLFQVSCESPEACSLLKFSKHTKANTSTSHLIPQDLFASSNIVSQNDVSSAETVILSDSTSNLELCSSEVTYFSYNKLFVRYDGQILPISGSTLNNTIFTPSIWLLDNNEKAVVLLVESEGTGLLLMNMHVIDLVNMTEIPYESPLTYLVSHMDSSVADGIVTLSFSDQTIVFDINEISPDYYEKAGYGGSIKYYLEDETIFSEISIHISPTLNLGYVIMKYSFEEDQYKITDMKFYLYDDNRIPYQIYE